MGTPKKEREVGVTRNIFMEEVELCWGTVADRLGEGTYGKSKEERLRFRGWVANYKRPDW